jgi:anti-sigma regulatory factor (Ser/Thr protein kinase)
MQPQEPTAGLTIRNDVAELVLVTEALDQLGERIGFPPKALMQFQVALDEILSNVVRYAWPDGGSHTFCVRIEDRGSDLAVVVTDDGLAFDPRAQPPPGPAGGRRPRPGGVGIQMVRQLVDGFDYARIGNLNCVTLIKRSGLDKTNKEEGSDGN